MANIDKKTYLREPALSSPDAGDISRSVTFRLAAGDDTAANVIRLARLPKYAKLLPCGWYIENEDVDSNATPTADYDLVVTDGTTTLTIINCGTQFQSAGTVFDQTATKGQQTGWVNYVTANDDFSVALLSNTAAATLVTTADIIVTFKYTMQLESGGV